MKIMHYIPQDTHAEGHVSACGLVCNVGYCLPSKLIDDKNACAACVLSEVYRLHLVHLELNDITNKDWYFLWQENKLPKL